MMEKRISRRDVLLLAALLMAGIVGLLCVRLFKGRPGAQVVIRVDGEVYAACALSEDQTIPIEVDGEIGNILTISDGQAAMQRATCPDKYCVRQTPVSRQGETIVCLPHKVVVEITSQEQSQLDGMVQ